MRALLFNHVIASVKKLSEKSKDGQMQNKILKMFNELLTDVSDKVSKRSFLIMVELYKKMIWRDKKNTNFLAEAAFSDYEKVSHMACHWLIETTENWEGAFDSTDEEDGMDEVAEQKRKNVYKKKTKGAEEKVERQIKRLKRKQKRRAKTQFLRNLFPIDEIYNPQDFTDRLFTRLQKGKDKFSLKLLQMAVISRMIGRHKLIQPNFYQFLQRYLKPGQKECAKVLMYVAEASHQQVPNDSMLPV